MKLIFVNNDSHKVRHLSLGGWWTRALLSVCCLGFPLGAGYYLGPLAMGGPETEALGEAYESPEFLQIVDELFEKVSDREQQLETLEALITKRRCRVVF